MKLITFIYLLIKLCIVFHNQCNHYVTVVLIMLIIIIFIIMLLIITYVHTYVTGFVKMRITCTNMKI